jgi:hypothetical protein
MGVSGERHATAVLLHPGKGPPVPIVQKAGLASELVSTQRVEEKFFTSAGDRTPVIQSVARHYTDWATPAHHRDMRCENVDCTELSQDRN